jgi:hypothetical protein
VPMVTLINFDHVTILEEIDTSTYKLTMLRNLYQSDFGKIIDLTYYTLYNAHYYKSQVSPTRPFERYLNGSPYKRQVQNLDSIIRWVVENIRLKRQVTLDEVQASHQFNELKETIAKMTNGDIALLH